MRIWRSGSILQIFFWGKLPTYIVTAKFTLIHTKILIEKRINNSDEWKRLIDWGFDIRT